MGLNHDTRGSDLMLSKSLINHIPAEFFPGVFHHLFQLFCFFLFGFFFFLCLEFFQVFCPVKKVSLLVAVLGEMGSADADEAYAVSLANKFIEKIEIFPEEQEDGSVIKSVTFRFPLKSNGDKIGVKGGTGLTTGTPVECVCLLSKTR